MTSISTMLGILYGDQIWMTSQLTRDHLCRLRRENTIHSIDPAQYRTISASLSRNPHGCSYPHRCINFHTIWSVPGEADTKKLRRELRDCCAEELVFIATMHDLDLWDILVPELRELRPAKSGDGGHDMPRIAYERLAA